MTVKNDTPSPPEEGFGLGLGRLDGGRRPPPATFITGAPVAAFLAAGLAPLLGGLRLRGVRCGFMRSEKVWLLP